MTDESSVISGANITDHHIAMVRDDDTIQTQVHTCSNIQSTEMMSEIKLSVN